MFDIRPVGYVIGLLIGALGLAMLASALADFVAGSGGWLVFIQSALITVLFGSLVSISCSNGISAGLSIRQTFVLTVTLWLILPVFGAIPFVLGETRLGVTDAFFEAMSGLTTTGATVIVGIDELPVGLKLWRGILQWLGGVGIIVVAMVFLPELRVGGMQIFRTAGFDTMGKILPRATEIASRISVIYVGLTLACAFGYGAAGMSSFDALVHAMTTIATGGMGNYDSSFAAFPAGVQYLASIFMVLAALPYVRYVQALSGSIVPLWRDAQVRGFLGILFGLVLMLSLWVWALSGAPDEAGFRAALFNVTSILTGTGYASANYMSWGTFAVMAFFLMVLIGGCAGSSACSVKVFRYQLLFCAVRVQIQRIHAPRGVFVPRYEGRVVGDDVMNSVMAFFVAFIMCLGLTAIALALTGLDTITAVSGAASALANIGPGLGETIGPAGNYSGLNDAAKWILAMAMLVGRLEILAVLTLLSWKFWRE